MLRRPSGAVNGESRRRYITTPRLRHAGLALELLLMLVTMRA